MPAIDMWENVENLLISTFYETMNCFLAVSVTGYCNISAIPPRELTDSES